MHTQVIRKRRRFANAGNLRDLSWNACGVADDAGGRSAGNVGEGSHEGPHVRTYVVHASVTVTVTATAVSERVAA